MPTESDWEKIKLSRIAGVPFSSLRITFPDLTEDALRKRAQRGDWPIPERVAYRINKLAKANGAPNTVQSTVQSRPTGQKNTTNGTSSPVQTEELDTPSAMEITLESTKGIVNASLGRFAQRAVKTVDNWDIPAPQSMKDGLALVNSLARLHQPAPQHLSQVNMQFVSPWGTASKFLEVEVETPEEP